MKLATGFQALALTLFAASGLSAQEGIELRWSGSPGDVFRQRMTMTQTTESSMLPAGAENVSVFALRQEVKDVSDEGVATVEATYEAIKVKIRGPVEMDYDSTQETGNDENLAGLFGALLGVRLKMEIEPNGTIRSIHGLDEAIEGVLEAVGDEPMARQTMEAMLNESTLRQLFEVNVFPEGPLEPEDTWERKVETELPMVGTMKVQFENRLEGAEEHDGKECARIQVSGSVSLEQDPASGSPMQISLSDQDISGSMLIDLATGMPVQSRIEMTIALAVDTGGIEIEMVMATSVVSELLGPDEPPF